MGFAARPARALTFAVLALAAALSGCVHVPPLIERGAALSAEERAQLGLAYDRQGLKKEALEQYRAGARVDASDPHPWMILGNFAFENGDLKEAERAYGRALRASRRHAGAANNLAMVYLARGKLRRAESLALYALRQEGPLKPYILDTLANIHIKRGRFDRAREALDQAQAAAPADDPSFRERLKLTRDLLPASP